MDGKAFRYDGKVAGNVVNKQLKIDDRELKQGAKQGLRLGQTCEH
jgi:hypothetical protein